MGNASPCFVKYSKPASRDMNSGLGMLEPRAKIASRAACGVKNKHNIAGLQFSTQYSRVKPLVLFRLQVLNQSLTTVLEQWRKDGWSMPYPSLSLT